MRGIPIALAITLLVGFAAPPPVMASNIVLNGSFEYPDFDATLTDNYPHYFYVRTDAIDDWTIVGSSLVVLDSRAPNWVAAHGNQYLELESGYGRAVEQALPTVPGVEYMLRFAYAANPQASGSDDSLNLYWDGVLIDSLDATATAPDNLDWGYHEYTMMANSTVSLIRFEDGVSGVDYQGPLLDNVSVSAVPPIPAPCAIMLASIGAGLVPWMRRRRTL